MSAVYIMASLDQICFIYEKTLRDGDTVVVKAKGLKTLRRSSQLREDGKSDTVLIVLDDDNAEDAENVSDQIQDDEDQTDNAELAEYEAELMSDDYNERDSAQCHKRHKVK
ncbi:hypothetical protein JTB14_031770 [Gonioctena quinquepunctata]|nr:hypothetical protein JTB14_031770 [Gonioctena quinquepunctata]